MHVYIYIYIHTYIHIYIYIYIYIYTNPQNSAARHLLEARPGLAGVELELLEELVRAQLLGTPHKLTPEKIVAEKMSVEKPTLYVLQAQLARSLSETSYAFA